MNKQTFQYTFYKSKTYIRIAMQNSSTKTIFDNKDEAMHYTKDEYSEYKFSIIDQIEEITRFDPQYYEFLLCYPECSICGRWKQKMSPLQYTESNIATDSTSIGLQQIDHEFEKFKGLMKSNSPHTILDAGGYSNDNWYYAIGVYRDYDNFSLPGPLLNGSFNHLHFYELFLRVPSLIIKCSQNLFQKPLLSVFLFVFLQNFS